MRKRKDKGSARQQRGPFVLGTTALTAVSMLAIVCAVLTLGPRSSAAQTQATQPAAQQAPAATGQQPSFDVASIKPATQDASGRMQIGIMPQPGGRLVAHNVTLAMLLQMAYELKGPKQVERAPDWADQDRYDIEAKATGVSGRLSREQLAPYLQTLLAERFLLMAHRETRQLPVYALVLAKPGKLGPQLMPHRDDSSCIDPTAERGAPGPSTSDGPPPKLAAPGGLSTKRPSFCGGFSAMMSPDGMRLVGNKITMEALADQLSGGPFGNAIGRIVIDRAGLAGTYDLSLNFSPSGLPQGSKDFGPAGPEARLHEEPGPVSSDTDSQVLLPTALQEQLGLKLEPQTGPVDVLVMDHVERPSEN